MPIDPSIIAQRRREQLARLQPVKQQHRQRADDLAAVRYGGGNQKVRERIEENGITRSHSFDLFVTPDPLTLRMVLMAKIKPGMDVLEPEAGTGRIAKAIRAAGVEPVCVEFAWDTFNHLQKQGFNVTQADFLTWVTKQRFDVILMNPPFSNLADVDHVLRAFSLLKAGGILVAIMGAGALNQQGKKAKAFRAWLKGNHGKSEVLPKDTFKESGTGVNAFLVTIRKGKKI